MTFLFGRHRLDSIVDKFSSGKISKEEFDSLVANQKKDEEECAAKAKIIELMNDWSDVMNSNPMCHTKTLACGFGVHKEEQEHTLSMMEKLFEGPTVQGKVSHLHL